MIPKIENTDDLIKFLEDTLDNVSKMDYLESISYLYSIHLPTGLCRFCSAYFKALYEYLCRKINGYLGDYISHEPGTNLQIRIDWLKKYKLQIDAYHYDFQKAA